VAYPAGHREGRKSRAAGQSGGEKKERTSHGGDKRVEREKMKGQTPKAATPLIKEAVRHPRM